MTYAHYYYNKSVDSNYRHEVHTKDCSYIEPLNNRVYIGYYSNCTDAIREAKNKSGKYNFDGCYWCSRNCHIG